MNVPSEDPYELKLFQMFQSCDTDSSGFLKEDALRRLVVLLGLHDKEDLLIAGLIADGIKPTMVSFDCFRKALLNFLGTEHDGNTTTTSTSMNTNECNGERSLVISDHVETYIESPPESSDREVSPKLVVGTKKYGRRSRPQRFDINEFSPSDSENADDTDGQYGNQLVQRSSSQTDIPNVRNQRSAPINGKLKRCASLPAQKNLQRRSRSTLNNKSKVLTGTKLQDELKKSKQSSSVESLDTVTICETISAQKIVDIWERANITNGRNILTVLGFDEEDINLSQLNKVLEDEIRGLDDDQQTTLLRAAIALQVSELSTVRQAFRQLQEENRKLRTDNKEANQRAALLAVEIDERHTAMEEATKKEIQMLEQRHAGVVRDLTTRMANDRENWSNLSARLETRIKALEQEELKLKAELESTKNDNNDLEGEIQKLQKQVTELLEKNIQLNNEMANLEDIPRNDLPVSSEEKSSAGEVVELMEKISRLQIENTRLRDKNDEMVAEMENMNLELAKLKVKNKKPIVQQQPPESSDVDEGNSLTAIKRRGDSPSKANLLTEESPRLGKLRKCSNGDGGSDVSDTSGDWMALNSELANSTMLSEETKKLKERIVSLEEELKSLRERSGKSPSPDERCKELEASLEQMQRAYEDCEDYWQSKLAEERQLFEKERQIYEDSEMKFTELMEKVREYEEQFNKDGRLSPIEEKDTLEQQFAELEAELEEVRENAQLVFEEKSKEIESLQAEVEDLRMRLGESVEILTGANELNTEAAANAAAQRNSSVQSPASSPISYLWHQSTIQEPAKNYDTGHNSVASLASLSSTPTKQANRNNLSTSETTIFSTTPADTSPTSATVSPIQKPNTLKTSPQSDAGDAADCDTASTGSGRSFETRSVGSPNSGRRQQMQQQNVVKANSSGDTTSCTSPSSIKEELKRLKFFELSLKEQIKDLSLQRDGLVMELQQLHEARPVLEKAYARTAHPSLIQRVNQLELRNRHLQNVIKQQQHYSEGLMQQSWRQHQMELTELHNRIETQGSMLAEQAQRLQNADILVKDLYVENSHLSAAVQRLEQQRTRINLIHQQRQGMPGVPGLPGMP